MNCPHEYVLPITHRITSDIIDELCCFLCAAKARMIQGSSPNTPGAMTIRPLMEFDAEKNHD